ncbi:MAG: M20 family metallopeptidase [Deltaproteobacteria bacterium]|nr:M20 family metallopeptidase [Deltaproteobacteria bacterium]MBW2413900.1 M20 family metallopeptidase [Deltaproteobacteria bacterium]
MASPDLKNDVCKTIDRLQDDLLSVSHEIHAHPELAFEEVRASALLIETLERADLRVEHGAYGLATAFETEFGPEGAPLVALLAEYDALPGIGHACGHNLIATASLGAALALAELGDALPGRVRLLGTPAEERGGGKELMARRGAFDGVDAAMMVHPAGIDLVTMPCIAIAEVEAHYRGEAAHASSMPHRGINALDALVHAYTSIAALRQHIKQTERLHGIITHGGEAPNIVPDRASGRFYVRARNADELEPLKRRVQACFEAGALATGARLTAEWGEVDYLELNTCWPLAQAYQENAEALGREFFPHEKLPASVAGSTDMGNVSHRVPSIHPMIAAAPPHCTIHNAEFTKWAGSDTGDLAALDGAKALAMTALDYLSDAGLRERVAGAFTPTA